MPYRRGQVDRDRHLLRDISDQVRRTRSKRSVTVGPWVLDVDDQTGALIATHGPSGTRRTVCVLDEPWPVEYPEPERLDG
jgi:hypothetical protein